MRFVNNIWMLLATSLLLATACQTTQIPNVRFYAEIPFIDCPEGAYVDSLTHKTGIIGCVKWKEMRPYMLMIDPTGKKQIMSQWSEACRWAPDGKCNASLDSVGDTIKLLDDIAGAVLGGGIIK